MKKTLAEKNGSPSLHGLHLQDVEPFPTQASSSAERSVVRKALANQLEGADAVQASCQGSLPLPTLLLPDSFLCSLAGRLHSTGASPLLVFSKLRPSEPVLFLSLIWVLVLGSACSLSACYFFNLHLKDMTISTVPPSSPWVCYPTPCRPLITLPPSFLLDPFLNSFINESSSPKRSLIKTSLLQLLRGFLSLRFIFIILIMQVYAQKGSATRG